MIVKKAVCSSALFLALASGGHAEAALLSRFVGNGDFAQASWSDGSQCGSVYVGRGGSVNALETYLYYLTYDCASGVVAETGFGKIPNADLQGDGDGRLGLATDTSGANFERWAGNGGPVTIEWNRTSDFTMKQAGSSQYYYGDTSYNYTSAGTAHHNSARAQGSVLGQPVSTSPWSADMGKNSSVQLVIERGQ